MTFLSDDHKRTLYNFHYLCGMGWVSEMFENWRSNRLTDWLTDEQTDEMPDWLSGRRTESMTGG